MTAPVAERSRSRRLRDPAIVGAVGAAAVALLHVHDPHQSGSYGICPFLELTGRPCAGCGGLRAVNNLTHGDLAGAVASNVLVVALMAAFAVAWSIWVVRRSRGSERGMLALTDRRLVLLLVVALAFAGLRNLPWGAALGP